MATTLRTARLAFAGAVLVFCVLSSAVGQSGRAFMEGYVIGESELRGIAGATVELSADPAAANIRGVKLTATTDADGKYAIEDIPHGPYTLRVSAPGYQPYEIPIYMLSDTQTKLHVRLLKANATGR